MTKPKISLFKNWQHKMEAKTSGGCGMESSFCTGDSCRREAKWQLWSFWTVPIFRMRWTHNSGLMNVTLRCNSLFRFLLPPLQKNWIQKWQWFHVKFINKMQTRGRMCPRIKQWLSCGMKFKSMERLLKS